jgi:di/tricarboxylate transporter
MYLISHVSAETQTTGLMLPSIIHIHVYIISHVSSKTQTTGLMLPSIIDIYNKSVTY